MGKARQVLHKSRKGKVDTESDHDTLPETAGDDPEPVKRKISKEHADILRDVAKMMTFATQDPTKQQTDPADKLPEASIPLPLLDALANDRRQSNSSTASQKKQTDAAFFFNEARKTTQRKRSQNSGACALAPDDEERKSSTFVDTLIESETMHHKLRNVVLQNEVNTKTQQIQRDKVLLVHKDNCLAAARAKSHVEARKLNTRLSEQADELRKVEKSKQKLNMIIMAKDRLLAKATIDVGFKVKTELVRHLRRLRDVLRSPNATVRHGLEEITKLETYELEQLAREDIEREVSDNDPDMQIFLLRQQLEDKTTELSEMTISHQIAEKRQAALQEKVEDLVKQLGGSIPLYTFLTVRDAVAGLNRDMATLKVAVTSLLAEGVFEDVEDTLLNELESREQTMVDKVAEAENKAEALEERLQKVEVRVNLFKDGIQSVIGTLIEAVPPADACRVPCSADETDEAEELPDVSQQAPTDSAQAFVCCQFLVVKETYEKKLKEVTSELEEAHGTIEERERELEDVRQRLDAMQKLAKTALTLKAECETLRAELSVAQTKAEESEAALHALRMEIAEIEKNVQAQISALEQRCQKAELRIPELLCERDNALGQVAALQEANEEMAAKLGSGTLGDLPEAPAEREDYVASLGTKLEQALLELTNGSSGTPDFLPAFLKKIYNQLSAAADSLGGSTVKVHQIRVASPSVRFRSRRVVMTAPASTYTGADEVDGNRPSQQQPPATADGKVQNKDCKSKRAPAAGRVRDCPPQEAGGNLEKTASHWTTGRDQLAMRALHTPPPVGGAPLADKSASPVEASDHPHGADGKKPAALDSEHPRLNHKRSLSVGAPRVAALYRSPSSQEECPAELRTASTTNSNPSRKMGSHFQKTVLAGSNVFAPKEAHRAEAAADSVSSEPDRDALNYAPSFSSVAAEAGSDGGRAKKAVPFYATVNLIPPKTAPKAASTRTIDKYLRLQAASNQQQTDAVSLHNVKSVEAFLDEICHPPPQLSPIKKRGSAGDAAGCSKGCDAASRGLGQCCCPTEYPSLVLPWLSVLGNGAAGIVIVISLSGDQLLGCDEPVQAMLIAAAAAAIANVVFVAYFWCRISAAMTGGHDVEERALKMLKYDLGVFFYIILVIAMFVGFLMAVSYASSEDTGSSTSSRTVYYTPPANNADTSTRGQAIRTQHMIWTALPNPFRLFSSSSPPPQDSNCHPNNNYASVHGQAHPVPPQPQRAPAYPAPVSYNTAAPWTPGSSNAAPAGVPQPVQNYSLPAPAPAAPAAAAHPPPPAVPAAPQYTPNVTGWN
eukprot:gene8879-13765_t